ncbi:MAG: Dinitrogenase iron-molybdenum cofactor biosynthesis protein [Thermoanaerobacterales bacterium 50_218]|nr:MAG: Dinitrogenase iron-molybdenum cofactor biosynthesis protein [Thermoanaerobacterales bacterium 50_218]
MTLLEQLENNIETGGWKMKIAVASVGTDVAAHFGHCEKFTIFEVVDGEIVGEKSLPRFC